MMYDYSYSTKQTGIAELYSPRGGKGRKGTKHNKMGPLSLLSFRSMEYEYEVGDFSDFSMDSSKLISLIGNNNNEVEFCVGEKGISF